MIERLTDIVQNHLLDHGIDIAIISQSELGEITHKIEEIEKNTIQIISNHEDQASAYLMALRLHD